MFLWKKDLSETQYAIMNLKMKIENHYKIKFNFDNKYLFYPFAEDQRIQKYSDLQF